MGDAGWLAERTRGGLAGSPANQVPRRVDSSGSRGVSCGPSLQQPRGGPGQSRGQRLDLPPGTSSVPVEQAQAPGTPFAAL